MFALVFLSDLFRYPLEFPARAFDPLLYLLLLLAAHFRQSFRQPPASSAHNSSRHFEVTLERGRLRDGLPWWLPLCFQKQFRLVENALADHSRAFTPGTIELSGFATVTATPGQSDSHPLAMFHADPRHRNQILHRGLGRDTAFPYLLLDALRQKPDQPQPSRYPAHAAIETAGQLLQ
jgi:hypothetical protein